MRGVAKSSCHGSWATTAPCRSATATEWSVEPVSTTTISSTRPRSDVRQASRRSASSLTMIAADSDTAPDRYLSSSVVVVLFGCIVVVVVDVLVVGDVVVVLLAAPVPLT